MKRKVTAQLIRQCQEGDPQALENLVRSIQGPVYFYCLRLIGNPEDAMDATQEILLAAVTELNTLRNPEAFTSWVDQITVRTCCRWMQQQKMEARCRERQALAGGEGRGSRQDPADTLDQKEARRAVVELVDALPAPQRLCVLMYYYGEMSVPEIASALHISENTIKSRLHYARKAIRKGLERGTGWEILLGASPVLFLGWILRREAAACALDEETAARLIALVLPGCAAAAGGAAKPLLGILIGKQAAVLAGLVLAGAVTGGVLHQPSRPSSVQPAIPAEQPAEPPDAPPAAPAAGPELPMPAEPPDAPPEPVEEKPAPQPVRITASVPAAPPPPAVPEEPVEPALPAAPEEPALPADEPPLPAVQPEPIPEPDLEPDLDFDPVPPEPETPESSRPVRLPVSDDTDYRPAPVEPVPDDPGPVQPDPPEEKPDPAPDNPPPEEKPDPPQEEPEERLKIVDRTLRDESLLNGYGGYGFTNTFARAWGGDLPGLEWTYSSTDPHTVAINEKGEYTH